jgi:ABC-type antimicrobial peptide transport system permease subunit
MREGLTLAFIGSIAGIVLALATSRLLETQLYGVRPHDPLSYGVTVPLLAVAAAVACWIPARRATSVSPMEALRTE